MTTQDTQQQALLARQEMPAGRSLWADAWIRLRRDWAAMLCLGVIALYVLIALGGYTYELIAASEGSNWPTYREMMNPDQASQKPTLEGFRDDGKFTWRGIWLTLGTDWAGRSVLAETLLSVRVSLTVAFMANIIAVPLGMVLGALAGFFGRKLDAVIVWLFTTLASIPGIILLIALKFAFQDVVLFRPPEDDVWWWWSWLPELDLSGIHGLYIALGITSWIGTCRLVRAEVFKIRELDYVLAARATGTSELTILFRHVLRNVMHLAIINFSLGFVGAISAEVILTYLGLGVEIGIPSWGQMINRGRMDIVVGRWWGMTSAVTAMFFLVLALNIFGDRLRDALDPRLRGAR